MIRITKQRKAIHEVFKNADTPLSIDEVLKRGKKIVNTLNLATVYRSLDTLLECGDIKVVKHPSFGTLYESTQKPHHHHFYCRNCNQVYSILGCALKPSTQLSLPSQFHLEDHSVVLMGLCHSCNPKNQELSP